MIKNKFYFHYFERIENVYKSFFFFIKTLNIV